MCSHSWYNEGIGVLNISPHICGVIIYPLSSLPSSKVSFIPFVPLLPDHSCSPCRDSLPGTEDCSLSSRNSLDTLANILPLAKMRQLKGKPKKETSKDKKERKQAMQEARQQITTVVLPTLAVVVLLIVVFVYVATRPAVTE